MQQDPLISKPFHWPLVDFYKIYSTRHALPIMDRPHTQSESNWLPFKCIIYFAYFSPFKTFPQPPTPIPIYHLSITFLAYVLMTTSSYLTSYPPHLLFSLLYSCFLSFIDIHTILTTNIPLCESIQTYQEKKRNYIRQHSGALPGHSVYTVNNLIDGNLPKPLSSSDDKDSKISNMMANT